MPALDRNQRVKKHLLDFSPVRARKYSGVFTRLTKKEIRETKSNQFILSSILQTCTEPLPNQDTCVPDLSPFLKAVSQTVGLVLEV